MKRFKGIKIRFRTKLFIYTTFLLTSVIAIINYHSIGFLKTVLINSSRSSSLDSAEKFGLEIQSRFEALESNIDNSIAIDIGNKESQDLPRIIQLMTSNSLIQDLLIFKRSDKLRLIKRVPETSDISEDDAKAFLENQKFNKQTAIYPHSKGSIFFAKTYDIPGSSDKLVVLVLLANKILMSNRYADNGLNVKILDQGLIDIKSLTPFVNQIHPKNRKQLSEQIKNDLWSGSVVTQNRKNAELLIHYYRIPVYNYIVAIQEDYDDIIAKINQLSREITKWIIVIYIGGLGTTLLFARRITDDLQLLNVATQKISEGKLGFQVNIKSRDEVFQLSQNINSMSKKLLDFLNETIQKSRLEAEVKAGKLVQEAFLKDVASSNSSIHIVGRVIPAAECCGDWFGSYSISKGVEFVVLADVTGHGVGSAMVSSLIYGAAFNYVNSCKRDPLKPIDPAQFLSEVNQLLFDSFAATMCATMIALVVLESESKIVYSNGGHPNPVFIRPEDETAEAEAHGEEQAKAKTNGARVLVPKLRSSSLVGVSPQSSFVNNTIEFKDGDLLFLYTDGLTELYNPAGKAWGLKKMMKTLQSTKFSGLDLTLDSVVAGIKSFSEGLANDDDISLIAIKRMDHVVDLGLAS